MIKMQSAGVLQAAFLPPVRTGGNLEWGACVVDGWMPMPVIVTSPAEFIALFGNERNDAPLPWGLF